MLTACHSKSIIYFLNVLRNWLAKENDDDDYIIKYWTYPEHQDMKIQHRPTLMLDTPVHIRPLISANWSRMEVRLGRSFSVEHSQCDREVKGFIPAG